MPPRIARLLRVRAATGQNVRRCFSSTRPRAAAAGEASADLLDVLESRGFVAAVTSPQLRPHLASTRSCIYLGVDPSASSLHVGNMLALMGLLHFHLAGHKVLALIGGATGSIGDPSGRASERSALSQDVLEHNVQSITSQLHRFFERANQYASARDTGKGKGKEVGEVEVVNNLDWHGQTSMLEFLGTVGRLSRVNIMLARESVKSRLDSSSGISFTEFTYQLLQAADFAHLFRARGCRVQLGGSDQWGNIVAGIDLIKAEAKMRRRAIAEGVGRVEEGAGGAGGGPEEAFGLTMPLLTTESGEKFGKSAGNAVWLDEKRTGVSDFYQFFFRAHDASVEQYLRLLTLAPLERIGDVMRSHQEAPHRRQAQRFLADEVTELVHGSAALTRAHTAQDLLYRRSSESPARRFTTAQILDAFRDDPRLKCVAWRDIDQVPVAKLAVEHGLCASRGEASRAIAANTFFVTDRKVADARDRITKEDLIDGGIFLLRLGMKQHVIFHVYFDE